MKPKYKVKHCKIHNLNYYIYLHRCPLCAGEEKLKNKKIKKLKLKD